LIVHVTAKMGHYTFCRGPRLAARFESGMILND
jgi:hypothetical protein